MSQLCRLCLSVGVKIACELDKETKIANDLSCLNIQIVLDKSLPLPTSVCLKCTETLLNMLKYRETVLLNQFKLLDLLNKTKDLANFYKILKEEFLPKDAIKEELSSDEDEEDLEDDTLDSDVYTNLPTKNNTLSNTFASKVCPKSHEDEMVKIGNQACKKRRRFKCDLIKFPKETTSPDIIRNHKQDIEAPIDNIKHYNHFKFDNAKDTDLKQRNNLKLNLSKCLTCLTNLPSRKELIEHYKTVHTLEETCKISNTDTNAKVKDVENQEDDKEKYQTESKGLYVCKICGRTFLTVHKIVQHGRAHSDTNLYCSHGCGYSTAYQGALRDHERRHEKDYKYKCANCGAGFYVKTWYDQHQNIHNNVKPFVCDICGLAFHMDRYLKTHRSSVHSDVIKGARQFICPHCDTSLNSIKEYKAHLETHIGKNRFLCDMCGKECSSSEQLKYHRNKHEGVKPYTCGICSKSFTKKHNLTIHLRAHDGLKHLCTSCGNHFAQRSTLLRHIRKFHSDIKQSINGSALPVEVQIQ